MVIINYEDSSARVANQRADFQTATVKLWRKDLSQFQRPIATRPYPITAMQRLEAQ
jgi:hypothetical protein